MEPITIRMLGEFSLEAMGNQISDADNRGRRVWSLLAYLLCSRDRSVSAKTLMDILWEDAALNNPENTMRITLHRLRGVLDRLWPGAGRELILYKDGSYSWNRTVPIRVDSDLFETLCQDGSSDGEERLERCLEALELYRGEFLPRYNSELWVIPIATHFQNRFLQVSLEAGQLLFDRQRYDEAAECCRRAAAAEPYHEGIHQLLMRTLGAKGDQKGAARVYDALSKRLFDDFGIRPSQETRAVYLASAHSVEDRALPMDAVLEQLQEPPAAGALVCDYDYFKILCFAESRSMERSGSATHVALLSVVDAQGDSLPRRSLERTMQQLEFVLRGNLRRGDTISRCSLSQFIIMLPKANYENSCMVCRRLLSAFHRAHSRSSARINYMVQPLNPSIRLPRNNLDGGQSDLRLLR